MVGFVNHLSLHLHEEILRYTRYLTFLRIYAIDIWFAQQVLRSTKCRFQVCVFSLHTNMVHFKKHF